jgi:hypothetical protein
MFSGLSELVIEDVEDAGEVIYVRARTRDRAVACPGCGAETARVHEYPERTAADVPADGRRVVVKVRVRRMRCPVLDCKVQTFREQVSGVLERYQRRISRLTAQVSAVARELDTHAPLRGSAVADENWVPPAAGGCGVAAGWGFPGVQMATAGWKVHSRGACRPSWPTACGPFVAVN